MNERSENAPNEHDASQKNGEHRQSRPGANGASSRSANGQAVGGFDFWTVADLLWNRWHWFVIGGIIGSAAFFLLGWLMLIKPKFTATVQLLRYETPATSDSFRPAPLSAETFAGLIASPDLLRRVGDQAVPPIPPEKLIKQIKVDPQNESDIVKVYFAAADPKQAVDLANLYAKESVAFTKELQAKQAAEIANNYLKKQLEEMDQDISALHSQMSGSPAMAQVSNKLAKVSGEVDALSQALAQNRPSLMTLKLSEKLQSALADLSELTSKYTDLHPLVQGKRAEIQTLQQEITSSVTNSNPLSLTGLANIGSNQRYDPNLDLIRGKLSSLEYARIGMANREREAELFAADPPGIVRVFAPATLKTVQSNHRRIKISALTLFGGLMGMGFSLGLILLTEAVDNRLRTADDLKRVTKLPVLTTLGDLNDMHDGSKTQWAFRTWTRLQGRLSRSQNHGLVCGITSSQEGEGRSTWIKLLAEAASLSGFRVLTIATRPSTHVEEHPRLNGESHEQLANMNTSSEQNQVAVLNSNVLSTPAQVTEQLTDPNSEPMVHIPLPGWVWNLDRRREWKDALEQWKQVDNLVIFVELPPASVPEAVLLGSNLPNVIWLADAGRPDASETRAQLQTLRDARCNLVGAVLNREQAPSLKSRFPRWLGCFAFFTLLGLSSVRAQETNLPPAGQLPVDAPAIEAAAPTPDVPQTNISFSVVSPAQRAPWQDRLTLGPGDVLTFSLYGEPTLTRSEVTIAPDGRVSYLEAQDVVATGLTVDELRAKVDQELGKYRRAARTIITPTAFRSKKYYVLGKVVQRGVYTLDHPTTVIEAIARAKGLESGLLDNNTVDLADFSRSFLMRNGKKMPLDFEKLFQQGDLAQNMQIEPGDYLYFPSANVKQIYVLGEVAVPGIVPYRPDSSVLTAISSRGGFNEKAYKSRVLVLRGSLNHPEKFAVDTLQILNGRAPDFKLQAKDIVYVSHRPFYKAEDLLDLATTAFIQSLITSWVTADILEP